MRLHNFFIKEPIGNKNEIRISDADLIHQLKDVFRYEQGNELILLDNSGFEFHAQIVVLSKNEAVFTILTSKENTVKPNKEVWLYASMIKKDNFEWILEKGTELGVTHFVPIISERSVKMNLNMERAQKILKEASEQSGRGKLPELQDIISFDEALEQVKIQAIAFSGDGENFVKATTQHNPIAIFIGPEGGWTEAELEKFKAHKVEIYSLGEQTLRAETAAIAVASLLLL